MSENQQRVWEVAKSHHLTEVMEYYCEDFESFCESLREADEQLILCSIVALILRSI